MCRRLRCAIGIVTRMGGDPLGAPWSARRARSRARPRQGIALQVLAVYAVPQRVAERRRRISMKSKEKSAAQTAPAPNRSGHFK